MEEPAGEVTVQTTAPAGLNPVVPDTTVVRVVVPPRVAALLVIELMVGTWTDIPMVTVLLSKCISSLILFFYKLKLAY